VDGEVVRYFADRRRAGSSRAGGEELFSFAGFLRASSESGYHTLREILQQPDTWPETAPW
jgi:hypothetical protein